MNTEQVRLMDLSHGAGCGCKIGPGELHGILSSFKNKSNDKRVLVGYDTGDDAAVVQITEDIAIVQTTDFFTPIMNDPYRFGQVAAANAISDIYAMGGQPLSALSLVAFPLEKLGKEILSEILRGGIEKSREAGIEIVGGHSIDDAEPKFGLAVTGTIHPKRIVRNKGLEFGDYLVLTKPLGVGILTTAIKRNLISKELEDIAFNTMSALNQSGSRAIQDCFEYIHAGTDITGFGLTGHLYGMLKDTNLKAVINTKELPILDGLHDLLDKKCYPGGTGRNFKYVENISNFSKLKESDREFYKLIACDPQTSGGLLIAVKPEGLNKLVDSLKEYKSLAANVIGQVEESKDGIQLDFFMGMRE